MTLGSVPFSIGVGPKSYQYIKYFAIPRKRPNERSECDLEQPTYRNSFVGCDTQGIKNTLYIGMI